VPLVRALEDKDPVSWQDTFYMYNDGSLYLSNSCGEFELRNSSHNVTFRSICNKGYYDEYLQRKAEYPNLNITKLDEDFCITFDISILN
jgi:hypothetical protein